MSKPIYYQVKVRDWPVWTKFVVRDDVAEEYEQEIKNQFPHAAVSIIPLYEHTDSAEIQKLTAQRDELLAALKDLSEVATFHKSLLPEDFPDDACGPLPVALRLIAKIEQEMK